MIDTIGLPKGNKELAVVMRDHADRERSRLAALRIQFRIIAYYMRGGRRITVYGPDESVAGQLELTDKGKMPVTVERFLADANRLQGLLQSIDVRPDIYTTHKSLASLKEKASARVVSNYLINDEHIEKVKAQAAHYFGIFGSVGIVGHVNELPGHGVFSEYEVVHPLQMMPFPSMGYDATQLRGRMRERLIDFEYLKAKYKNVTSATLSKMEYWEREIGEAMDADQMDLGITNIGGRMGMHSATHMKKQETSTQILVRVRELWVDGPNGTCSTYAVSSGEHMFERYDDETGTFIGAIGWDKFIDVGDFHGAGLYRLQFGLVSRYEKLIEDLINNVKELDKYPVVVMPRGTYNERTAFQDKGNELRLVMVEPDYPTAMISGQNAIRPTMIQPNNSGDLPGRTAAYLGQVLDSVTPVRDLIQEKGRIDALPAMQFIEEERTRSISGPISNFSSIFAQAHRAVISKGARQLAFGGKPIPVGTLSLDLIGLKIDQKTQTMSFLDNPLPNIRNIRVTTKQTSPRSEAVQKLEAMRMLELLGPEQFDRVLLFLIESDIDISLYHGDYKEAYNSVVENILTLFGDGQENEAIVLLPFTEMPEFQLRLLRTFMASNRMKLAAPEIIEDFIEYVNTLMAYMGMVVPQNMPDPYLMQGQGQPILEGQNPQTQGTVNV